MEFDDSDFLLKNGYLSKGDPLAICGAAGIGKSRLILQLLIAIITGRDFLGWPTNGKGSRWLLLQTENVCRRLKSDLWAMFSILSQRKKNNSFTTTSLSTPSKPVTTPSSTSISPKIRSV